MCEVTKSHETLSLTSAAVRRAGTSSVPVSGRGPHADAYLQLPPADGAAPGELISLQAGFKGLAVLHQTCNKSVCAIGGTHVACQRMSAL